MLYALGALAYAGPGWLAALAQFTAALVLWWCATEARNFWLAGKDEVNRVDLWTVASRLASNSCQIPPPGWRCTRVARHEGPCAAVPE